MGLGSTIKYALAVLFVERPVRKLTLAQLAVKLETTGQEIDARVAAGRETAANRAVLGHIIGIERWGQRRLRTLLGETLVMDEYDGYRPSQQTGWSDLRAGFNATRQETIALLQALEQAGVGRSDRVPHNDYGPLSPQGWLRYLNLHASIESRRIR